MAYRAVVMELSSTEVFPNTSQQEFCPPGRFGHIWKCLLVMVLAFPDGASGKEPACQCRRHETRVRSLGGEDPLEAGMATHSSILAWGTPGTEEPGRLQSMGSQRVRYD